jgi:hypothetical protein
MIYLVDSTLDGNGATPRDVGGADLVEAGGLPQS